MNTSKFAILVTELEKAGAVGHQAYELANTVDSAFINYASREEIAKIAKELISEENWENESSQS